VGEAERDDERGRDSGQVMNISSELFRRPDLREGVRSPAEELDEEEAPERDPELELERDRWNRSMRSCPT
jgi:hypothetical protein